MNWKKNMTSINDLENKLFRLQGEKIQLQKILTSYKKEIKENNIFVTRYEQAKEIIRQVGLKTQQQLQVHISNITSLALEAVFNDPYKLVVEFIQRRNKTECDLYFEKKGNKVDPLTASGGGVVDVASFALRIASWSMQTPKSTNTILLDEPLRFLSKEKQSKASEMIKEISEKLGIQFIIITHEPALSIYADKIFEVTQQNNISKVKES